MAKLSDFNLTPQDVINILTKVAEQERLNDGYSDIRTPNLLANGIDYYIAGLKEDVPKQLQEYLHKAIKESDPEWQNYLRLKDKFENK